MASTMPLPDRREWSCPLGPDEDFRELGDALLNKALAEVKADGLEVPYEFEFSWIVMKDQVRLILWGL